MFRKRNGSLGFSFTRRANAAIPNLASDDANTNTNGNPSAMVSATAAGLRKDMCYAYQIASPNPLALDERSFHIAGVADTEAASRRVHKALTKYGILHSDNDRGSSAYASSSNNGAGQVDTQKISKDFIHQLAFLNVSLQRELVNLLFWWEEETQRLKKLIAEEKELDAIIGAAEEEREQRRRLRWWHRRQLLREQRESERRSASNDDDDDYYDGDDDDDDDDYDCEDGDNDDDDLEERARLDQLKFARERVRMRLRQRPSQRRADVEADRDDLMMDAFYGGGSSSSGIDATATPVNYHGTTQEDDGDAKPPEYSAY